MAASSSSASSSSATSEKKRRVVRLRRVNREDTYEGPQRSCKHLLPCPRLTSWTDKNPGRRFYRCPLPRHMGQCDVFDWHDDEGGEWQKAVIKELLDYVDRLYDENAELQTAKQEFENVAAELKKILQRNEPRNKQLVDVMKKRERKYKLAMALLMLTCVFLVLMLMGGST